MAGSDGATEASLDIGAILDRALETAAPKARRPTKTQQLREQRAKIAALRAKGFTLVAIAEMVGASKDTLRQALRTPTKMKKKMAAHAARRRAGQATTEEQNGDGKTVAPKVVPPGRKRKFPSSDDL